MEIDKSALVIIPLGALILGYLEYLPKRSATFITVNLAKVFIPITIFSSVILDESSIKELLHIDIYLLIGYKILFGCLIYFILTLSKCTRHRTKVFVGYFLIPDVHMLLREYQVVEKLKIAKPTIQLGVVLVSCTALLKMFLKVIDKIEAQQQENNLQRDIESRYN